MKLGLQPDWIEDMLGLWASSDTRQASGKLAWAPVSPMFELWGVVDRHADSDGSYSEAEVLAMRQAVERLREERPDMWSAILATFKPWTGIEATSDTLALAKEAGPLLASWVDEALGD